MDEEFDIVPALCTISSVHYTLAAIACLHSYENIIKNKKKRRWIKEWRTSRNSDGNVQHLLNEFKLAGDNTSFKFYLRMDETCFNMILHYIEKIIKRKNTIMRAAIPVAEKLAVTLRFLAKGEDFKELDENSKLSASYLRSAIIEVCTAIYETMKADYLKVLKSSICNLKIFFIYINYFTVP